MRRVILWSLALIGVLAGGYAVVVIALLILASVASCGCATSPSPPLP